MISQRDQPAPRPTAGALRLIEASTPEPAAVNVGAYARQMTTLCPYLAPSLHRGLTTWTVYEIASSEAAAVEAELFFAGAQAAEWLRPLLARPGGALRCENVVVLGEVPGTTHRALMGWPHWALKHLYGPVGVMFGKFYAGEFAWPITNSGEPRLAGATSRHPCVLRRELRGKALGLPHTHACGGRSRTLLLPVPLRRGVQPGPDPLPLGVVLSALFQRRLSGRQHDPQRPRMDVDALEGETPFPRLPGGGDAGAEPLDDVGGRWPPPYSSTTHSIRST